MSSSETDVSVLFALSISGLYMVSNERAPPGATTLGQLCELGGQSLYSSVSVGVDDVRVALVAEPASPAHTPPPCTEIDRF